MPGFSASRTCSRKPISLPSGKLPTARFRTRPAPASEITAWNGGTKVATLASAPTDVAVGDRFTIGLGANVYRRMLIHSITPLKDLEARIEMVDEAPAVVACLS